MASEGSALRAPASAPNKMHGGGQTVHCRRMQESGARLDIVKINGDA